VRIAFFGSEIISHRSEVLIQTAEVYFGRSLIVGKIYVVLNERVLRPHCVNSDVVSLTARDGSQILGIHPKMPRRNIETAGKQKCLYESRLLSSFPNRDSNLCADNAYVRTDAAARKGCAILTASVRPVHA